MSNTEDLDIWLLIVLAMVPGGWFLSIPCFLMLSGVFATPYVC